MSQSTQAQEEPRSTDSLVKIQRLRLSLAFFALLDVAAHLFAGPSSSKIISYWIDIETASYGLIAVIYLLGLRQFYSPPLWFTAYNMFMYFLSGFISLPFGINPHPLTGHIEFAHYSFGRGFSLIAWVYLLLVGWWMLKHDRGSKLNELLRTS
ncbi:MAG: hypothetical protein M1294_16745 [Firmicutes bacterium]|jgi:hypothetical protein|uniref:Uncharacterized protein n=1 Tax=Sulfobacillus benefaciens TaxID=453960 RepID=A0A2T2X4C0_9FIRM|nr:hypothetical protein [Bacillota bacterium]MCL5013987.1 hypothetical protein [Bacillota bacterium]PSR29345.1 MAG: hypothetical protein C7B43_08350 [Sulfobacillus benefaciens]HBQ95081.1 hypothetical protein [Sulfobacillus sp.]